MESDEQLVTGFHHNTVLSLAPEIIDAVKEGKIKRFFVIAGCDAPGKGGEYYRELATSLPQETVILTTSCGNSALMMWITVLYLVRKFRVTLI